MKNRSRLFLYIRRSTPALIILVVFFGCSSSTKVSFKTSTFMSAGKQFEFEWIIPKGYKNQTSNLYNHLLKQYEYSDSTLLYISLDISYANSPNYTNWITCSRPEEKYKCEEGEQKDGRFWKEVTSNDLVVGYLNVPASRKAEFDQALGTLKRHE